MYFVIIDTLSWCLPRWKIDCRVSTMDADRYDGILSLMPNDRTLVQGIYSEGEILLMINTGHQGQRSQDHRVAIFLWTILQRKVNTWAWRTSKGISSLTKWYFFSLLSYQYCVLCSTADDAADVSQTLFLFFSLLAFNYPLSDINCQFVIKFYNFLKDLKPTTDSFILWSMVLLYFNFEIEDKTPHKDGPTWPPGHWFHFPIFQIRIFGVSKRWVLSVSLQLKLRHRASTLQIIPLNISLFTSQCNADFGNRTLELKIPFCTFKGLQFNKELSSMRHLCLQRQIECLKRASLAAAFPIIVTDYCNFPLTIKTI